MHKKLKIISYENYSEYERIYQERLNSTATITTKLKMFPFSQKTELRITQKSYPIFLMTIPDIIPLIEKLYNNSESLTRISQGLPGVAQSRLFLSLLTDEIKSTNDIEGVKSTRSEINEAIRSVENNDEKVRFQGIVNLYKSILENNKIEITKLSDLRNIYDKLVLDEISDEDKPDGELFRRKAVYIKTGSKTFHAGNPNEESINSDLLDLIDFMNNSSISYIFKAIITHYFFEYIHPFYDGNGRVGRFLISIYLGRKLDMFTGLSVSQGVLNNKKRYEDAFIEMSHPKNNAEITHFVIDMMKIIISGQEIIMKRMSLLKKQLDSAEAYIKGKEWSEIKSTILSIYFQNHLFEFDNELLTNIELTEFLKSQNIKRTKVDKITKELYDEGYLSKVKSRPVVYKLSDSIIQKLE